MTTKNINEIILEEILKIHHRLERLEDKVDKGFADINKTLFEFAEVHVYIGNKVFGDIEERLTSIESERA